MKPAFKVASSNGSYTSAKHSSYTTTAKRSPQRYYTVSGIWPRYEVVVNWDEETRQVLWGSKAFKAFEVAMRIEGYVRHRPKVYKKLTKTD